MCGAYRAGRGLNRLAAGVLLAILIGLVGCSREQSVPETVAVPGVEEATKTSATGRAERRLYDGAPPVIPHEDPGMECIQCHNATGVSVPGLGFAPATPHELTEGMSAMSRCRQCHVFRTEDAVFVANRFVGLAQDLRRGSRLYPGAPPVIPHSLQMRENCQACHTGPAAREEIRTSHPERARCEQCHVPRKTHQAFAR